MSRLFCFAQEDARAAGNEQPGNLRRTLRAADTAATTGQSRSVALRLLLPSSVAAAVSAAVCGSSGPRSPLFMPLFCSGSRVGCGMWASRARGSRYHREMRKDRPQRLGILYISQPIYFITFCTRDRRKMASLEKAHTALIDYSGRGFREFSVSVGSYTVMPDHVHLFVSGQADFSLSRWVAGLKRAISRALEVGETFWQPGFFDHVIRNDESYLEKSNYVFQNPVRAGLVEEPQDWAYQGNIVSMEKL
jgi:putative transposase